MTGDAMRDLEQWIPKLLAVWRQQRRGGRGGGGKHGRPSRHEPRAPQTQLTHDELKEVGAGVKALSHGLTRERALAGARYMDDPRLLGAYLLFYWPVSYAQARATLSELPSRPRATLDLGSGPGPLAFAALDAGASGVVAADRSKSALELAKALAMEAGEPLSTRDWAPERPLPEGRFDLITLGHVLNELYAGDLNRRAVLVEKLLERVNKGGTLLILEPALRETSRALLQVRDVLVSHGVAVRAPCLWRGACPALVRPSDWCHAEREWRLPPMVEAIGRAAGLRKETLKMSYLALAPRGEAWAEPPEGQVFRIVSEPLEGKGRQRFMGCGPSGRVGLAMQERHETERNRLFFKLQRGDVVRVTQPEERGDGLALADASTVAIVAHAGRPVPLR
ncbi:MAG: methyltransferase domain-containing protein [Myxococcales bacterium]|nr:methyltransferase domain-containing protein [Myxococcales bacterium]